MSDFSSVGRTIKNFGGGSNPFATVAGGATETLTPDSFNPVAESMSPAVPMPADEFKQEQPVADITPEAAVAEAQELVKQAEEFYKQNPFSAPALEPAPVVDQREEYNGGFTLVNASDVPCFTVVDVDEETTNSFAKEFSTSIHSVDCIAEKGMLLDYMVRLERTYGVTMPFRACGIDTIAFDRSAVQTGDGGPTLVELVIGDGEKKHSAFYEKITVDDVVYLSCISESLNEDYMYRVLSQATEAIYTHGKFVFTLVGPRYLGAFKGEDDTPKFIDTLNLNSFELSVLNRHMGNLEGVSITYGTYNGKTAVMYRRG